MRTDFQLPDIFRTRSTADLQRLAHLRLLLGAKLTQSAQKRTFAGRLVNHFTAAWFCPLQVFNGAEDALPHRQPLGVALLYRKAGLDV